MAKNYKLVLRPQYDKKYTSQDQVILDWSKGVEFRSCQGPMFSINDNVHDQFELVVIWWNTINDIIEL